MSSLLYIGGSSHEMLSSSPSVVSHSDRREPCVIGGKLDGHAIVVWISADHVVIGDVHLRVLQMIYCPGACHLAWASDQPLLIIGEQSFRFLFLYFF